MELASREWPAQGAEISKIVLLHGMGGTGSLWRPLAAGLERDCSVLAPDQRGHGGSRIQGKAEYDPLAFGRDVVETMRAKHFHPAYVVGHSMGVRTAAATAHLAPKWVRGLVLVDLGFYGPAGGGLGDTLARFLEDVPLSFASRQEAKDYMAVNCPDAAIGQYLMAVLSIQPPAPGQPWTFPFDRDALIATIDAVKNFDFRPWIREAASRGIAVLALRGETSSVWSHEDFEAERERFADMPLVEFEEFRGTGHGLPFDKRMEFLARLRRFVTEHP
jgi:pimeloyl-ACP methyl ester carboxylesterase